MSCSCNGICSRQKTEPVRGFHKGQKYCSVCTLYITTEEPICFCCNRKYRIKKRSRWKQTAPKIDVVPYFTPW